MKKLLVYLLYGSIYTNANTNLYFQNITFKNEHDEMYNSLGFVSYGNWCGPGHGGFQDCCNGSACSNCDLKKGTPTDDCFNECPPIDELDYYCALHDECCLNNPKDFVCFPEGNKCFCDCALIEGANNANDCDNDDCHSYRYKLIHLFKSGLSCWYNNEKNISTCNIVGMRTYTIESFCNNGKELNPF